MGLPQALMTPFQALVMVKSIHRTGGRFLRLHIVPGTASTFAVGRHVQYSEGPLGFRYALGSSSFAFRCKQGLRVHFKV
jgi:hypothetical protein